MVYVIQVCWNIPLLCVQWKTPDDGQRNCPKHIGFHSKNKFETLVHIVGFIIRIKLGVENLTGGAYDWPTMVHTCKKDLPIQDNSLSLQALHTHPTSTSDNKINSAFHGIQELWITKKTYLYLWMADLCATRRLWHTWHKAWRTCGSSDWSTANNTAWTRDNSFSISTHCSRTCNYTNKFVLTFTYTQSQPYVRVWFCKSLCKPYFNDHKYVHIFLWNVSYVQ